MPFLHVALGSDTIGRPCATIVIPPLLRLRVSKLWPHVFLCFSGGAISLLALNGLFILIHKHNL